MFIFLNRTVHCLRDKSDVRTGSRSSAVAFSAWRWGSAGPGWADAKLVLTAFSGVRRVIWFCNGRPGELLAPTWAALIRPSATFSQREKVGIVPSPSGPLRGAQVSRRAGTDEGRPMRRCS